MSECFVHMLASCKCGQHDVSGTRISTRGMLSVAIALAASMAGTLFTAPSAAATRAQFQLQPGYDVPDDFNDIATAGSTYTLSITLPATSTLESLFLTFSGERVDMMNIGVYKEFRVEQSYVYDVCGNGACQDLRSKTLRVALPGPSAPPGEDCSDVMFVRCNTYFTPFYVTASHGYLSTGAGVVTLAAFSQGVPEPATWALVILGFGAVGSALRRRPRPRVTSAV